PQAVVELEGDEIALLRGARRDGADKRNQTGDNASDTKLHVILRPWRGAEPPAPDVWSPWHGTIAARRGRVQGARQNSDPAAIHNAMATIIRFSVRDTKPRGTLESPPTQAHLSSRRST